ncbi:hypothetical protein ACJMK2_025478 [Sinanodonta woodiana]|uniref:Uncharacterized protein n=1 Tax=Sinanodonta woodiana TaxID=1069815 RepID=A0ABD3XKC6_SINWO
MPPIKPHPIPIMSTSSKIELTSEHMFKIPSLPQTISSEHPLVDGIVTNSSTETSLHHAHLDGNILPMHPHLPQNLHSDSDVSALNKQNNTLIKTGTVSTTAHDLHLNTFNIKKLELNLDKKNAENIFPSQAQASGAQSASNMMHVSSSSITDSTNVLINTSREYLDDIETRISIAELILADQLIAHEAGQNNTANIENDLNTMKTKLVSLEDKFRKMENKLIKVATDLTKVKTLTSPLKSSRKEIFRKIGLDFHFPKEKTTIVNTPAWDMKKRHVGKAPEISKNVSKDENVINSVPNIVLRKLIADLALNINSASQNESIPKTTTIANIDTWMITPQQILAPSDRVNPTKGMSLDIYTTGLLVPGSQSALNHNGIHEPQKSQTNSHPSSSAIKSAHVLNKHLPTESLLRRSPAVPVNALDLGRSSIDAGNPGRLTSLGELTVFQQPVQDNSSRRFNRIENMGIQVIQGRADIQSRDKIVLQPDMNSAPRSNRQRSLIFDSSGSDTLQSRTREMTDSSVQRTAVQANSIPDRNIGEVFVSSRETPQLSPRSQWQMIRTAQDVIDLRSSIENGETNNIRQVVPSMSRAFNSGVGNNRAVQTNALLSRGSTQQSQQQREQVNEQQLHSQQHSQQHVQRSSGSLSLSFLNRSSQVQSPLVRTFQPRTLMSQGQILPFVPAQNRFVNQQFRAPNSRSLGNINSQSQQPTVVARQSVRLFPIAGMF